MRAQILILLDREKPTGQLLRFVLIGGCGATANFIVYSATVLTGLHYIPASFLGWFCGLLPTFYLNRRLTFRSRGGAIGDFIRTVFVYLGQQLVMIGALMVFVDGLHLSAILSYFLALPVAVVASFFGMKYFAMRQGKTLA